ncbi:MAG TPA: molybdopterin converting factor subunit 1 [Bacillota bacterium]|nr:molybdopterin converting factor subunit 1 [Bacillota bacterium]
MIDVLYFAELRDVIGSDKVSYEAAGLTVAQFKEKHLSDYHLTNLDEAMIAINEEYASEETVLQTGDTLAFIPPVSGG